MINLLGIKKKYKDNIVVDIPYLSIEKGEIVGFVGNNGAGKTTLFRLFLDLVQPTEGHAFINGIDVSLNEIWKRTTGSYLDSGFLIEYLTAEEFFSFIASVYKIPMETFKIKLEDFEKLMNNEILNQRKYIRSLSSGNKQKVGIIAAMIINPELLILDEPFNFLDPTSQIVLKELLKKLHSEFGTTIIISSHNLEHIVDISSRIILLEKGLVIKDISNRNREAEIELFNYFALGAAK